MFQVDHDQELGRGAFGAIVYRGTFSRVEVAIKSVPRALLFDDVLAECRLISHPNVVKTYYVEEIHHSRFYVMELCHATLYHCFLSEDNEERYDGPLPSEVDGLLQMASGLDYIHSKHLVHQNIKPQNILISTTRPVQFKLSEIGLHRAVPGTSRIWMAPELLGPIDAMNASHLEAGGVCAALATALSDVWSLGCIFFFFLRERGHPFGEKDVVRIFNILEGNPYLLTELTTPTDHEWKLSLVADMVVKTPEERSQLIEIKKHLEFVASYINDLNESKSSPESLTDDGSSLLHFAAQLRSRTAPSLMAEFLSKSSNVNVPDKHGRTPLDIAAGNRSQWAPLLIRQLRRRGARYSQPLPTPHRQASHVKTDRLALSTLSSSDMKKQVLENVRDVSIKDSEGYEWV